MTGRRALAPTRRAQTLRRPTPATLALAGLIVAAGILLLYSGRRLTFFFDEWTWITTRRGSGLGTFLDPHNGHFSLFPVVVYKLLFALVGLRHYTPYRVAGVALHLLCCGLVYVLARRRIGPWAALAPTALLLFMGSAFQDLLWPFQIGYLASIAGGLGALALIEEPRADGAAAALLVWSVISSGIGIPFLIASLVALLTRRDPWRRLWIVAVPAAVFVSWYVGWGTSEHVTTDAVLQTPQYVSNAAAGVAAGIAGLTADWGPALAVAGLGLIALRWATRADSNPTPMLLAAGAGVLSFWILTGLTRADSPDPAASRYLYVGAVFVFLIAAEARLGARVRTAWLGPVVLLVLAAVIANLGILRTQERLWRAYDASVRASLTAVEVAAPVVSPAFEPNRAYAPQLTAGPYLAAVRDLGSPAYTVAQLRREPTSISLGGDQVLEHAEALRLGPSLPGPGACTPSSAGLVTLQVRPGATLRVAAPAGEPVLVYLRRFAGAFQPRPVATVSAGRTATLRFPLDLAPQVPWSIRLLSARPTRACVS